MTRKTILQLLAILIAANPILAGTVYHVSKTGDDGNSGLSWYNAWATIEMVNATISAGDTVYFGTGRWLDSQIRPPLGGNASNQTLYACSTFSEESKYAPKIYGGEIVENWQWHSGNVWKAYWDGSGCLYSNTCGTLAQDEEPLQGNMVVPIELSEGEFNYLNGVIYTYCRNGYNPNECEMIASCKAPVLLNEFSEGNEIAYVKFWGLDLRYGEGATVYFNARTNHISVEHCNIGSAGAMAANACCVLSTTGWNGKDATDTTRFGAFNTIRSCEIGNTLTYDTTWSTGVSDGIIIYAERSFTVDSCYFHPPIATAINFKGKGTGTHMPHNVAKFNTIVGAGRYGIDIWVHPYQDSVYGNIIVDSKGDGIMVHTSSEPWLGDITILNNTIYGATSSGIAIWDDRQIGHCGDGIEIRYNIIHTAYYGVALAYWGSNACQDACVIDNNMYYNISRGNECSGGTSWGAWQGCGFDLDGSYSVNPGFNDAVSGNFARPGASQEMSRGDYGDRYWTVWGAVQPSVDCDLPDTPMLVSPSNGGTDVGWPVSFDWSDVSGSTRYQIQVDTDANFVGSVVDFQPSQSTYSTSGLYPETLHYWRTRVLNDCGWGTWSSVRSFTTSGLIVDAEEELAFATECGEDYHISQPTLVVQNASLDEDNIYHFEVAMDSLFANIAAASSTIVQQPGETTAWKVTERLDAGTDYYWRASVNLDEYSDACKFRVYPMTHVYPDPFRLNDVQHVTFTEVPEGYALLVVTTTGERVRRWGNTDGGDIIWDGTNERGESVAPGVYLWYIEELDIKGKFTVIR